MYFVKENYCNENYLSARFLTVADKMKVNLCNCKRTRKSGFTLVELLVVIAIIGILATLITAAAFRVIATTRVTTVRMKINELEQALELYKNKFGEYPPMLEDTAAVTRHIKKRWPRTTVTAIPSTNKDSLVFWLGGFRNEDGKYCGFSVNKENPFQDSDGVEISDGGSSNTYDNEVFIELNESNVKTDSSSEGNKLRVFINMGSNDYPVVYFRGRKGGGRNAYRNSDSEIWQETTSTDVASPYLKENDKWHNPERFQLIHPGADGHFGSHTNLENRRTDGSAALDEHDYDNITNLGTSTIEALLP